MNGLHPELVTIYENKLNNTVTFEQFIANRSFTHFSEQPIDTNGCVIEEIMLDKLRVIYIKPKQAHKNAPCFIWFHGGGMVFGNPDDSISYLLDFVHKFQAVVLIPQYRLAPEHPYPAALEDGYNMLLWANKQAQSLKINREKIIVCGGSAGGNLALAVTLKARDEQGPSIAGVLPLYPMLDWQTRPFHKQFTSPGLWNVEKNEKSWMAYLKNCQKVPPYASPFYAALHELPPIYTFIGTHDLFFEEVCEFVEKLNNSKTTIIFDIYEGCFHGFDLENVPIAKTAKKRLLDVTEEILNKVVTK
ncbi:alpha/beta hydrolase [Solibacillus daqui]|uniref:alpha/beta hydrolase n=1 Tax=Solibacillus daqui TaxID=2912187 RepID=UPI0023669100|nr:alpha/beta hydrolase [Solibacillus daqui]